MTATGVDSAIERFRERITDLDLRILELLNDRLAVVSDLVAHKLANEISLSDFAREKRLLEQLSRANKGPLSALGVEQLHRFLLAVTRREVIDTATLRPPSKHDWETHR